MREPSIQFTGILPGMNCSATQVQRLLEQLSTSGSPRPLVLETFADDSGIHHFVGRSDSGKFPVRALLRTYLPEARTMRTERPDVPGRIARLRLTPKASPLHDDALETTLRALYGVLASRRKGETIAIQVVLGRGRRPAQVPAKIADPATSISRLLLHGTENAPAETRRRIAAHVAQPRIDVTVRVGVTAAVPERRRQLRRQLLGAMAQLEAPGAHLSFTNEAPAKWGQARSSLSAIAMSAAQLTALLCWPVNDLELPGLPPRHPRLLAPPKGVTNDGAGFARATAHGIDSAIGLAPESRLQHLAITGGTGSGKSQVFATLVLADITAGRPTVLIEPKRQLVDHIVSRAPMDAAGMVVVIDASDPVPVGFNPLDIGERDAGPVVDGIIEVLKVTFADGWGPRTEDLLHVSLQTLVADGQRRGVPHTLLDLVPLISDDGYRRSVIGSVAGDATLAAFWATFNGLSAAHRASIVAAPLNKLRKLVLRKNVASILGVAQPKLRLRDIWKSDLTVLVPLNDALIGPGAAQLLGGLIVSEIWLATQERALEAKPQERPGMVFIDEVQRYLHLPTSIDDALATSRSYGIGWHLAAQGRSQLPPKLALALELNARNQITFAASPHDAAALAKTTTLLTKDDFQQLGRFEIYANLVADGAPAGWFSAATLPPGKPQGHDALIRAAYRDRFAGDGAAADQVDATATVAEPPHPAAATAPASPPASAPSHQRKRRPS